MYTIYTHHVVVERYKIPDEIAKQGKKAIADYLATHDVEADRRDSKDWEIVEISEDIPY